MKKLKQSAYMWKKLKSYFLTGLVVLIPLVLTVYIIWNLFLAVDGLLQGFIGKIFMYLGFIVTEKPIVGPGFISVIFLILLTGVVARNYMGKKVILWGEMIVTRIPLMNRIYLAIKQISNAFLSEKREIFKKAVLFEYPRKGIYSIGFFTQDTKGEVQERLDHDVVSVFLPTTPNPTSGFLLFVAKSDVVELDMSIEEALKLVISGGAVVTFSKYKKQIGVTVSNEPNASPSSAGSNEIRIEPEKRE